MKHLYTCLFLLISLIFSHQSVAQGSLAALDASNAFKGHVFSSNIENYKDLTNQGHPLLLIDKFCNRNFDWYLDSDLEYYQSRNRTDVIGDLEIKDLKYYSFNKKLMRVEFNAYGDKGSELVQLYKSLYGKPKVIYGQNDFEEDIIMYLWQSKKVSLSVTNRKIPPKNSETWFRVIYLSKPILAEQQSNKARVKGLINKDRARDL